MQRVDMVLRLDWLVAFENKNGGKCDSVLWFLCLKVRQDPQNTGVGKTKERGLFLYIVR